MEHELIDIASANRNEEKDLIIPIYKNWTETPQTAYRERKAKKRVLCRRREKGEA